MTELPDGLSQTSEEFIARLQLEDQALRRPLTVDDLMTILEPTIKHDNPNKVITLLTMLLTYTENDQINHARSAKPYVRELLGLDEYGKPLKSTGDAPDDEEA